MLKGFCIFIIYLFSFTVGFAPQDSVKSKPKKYRSVYDTSSIYYNKGKLNFNLESGTSQIGSNLSQSFGYLSSYYKETILPVINFSVGYGMGEKSRIGISTTFQQVNYYPTSTSSGRESGRFTLIIIGVRYMHCIGSWKYFYYGFQVGASILNPSFDSNTFYGRPKVSVVWLRPNIGALFGMQINITKHLLMHVEGVFNTPILYWDAGLTYKIETRKKTAKK